MDIKEERNSESQILVEFYKLLSEEQRIYLREQLKCFFYAAILVALYFGVGLGPESEILTKIRPYLPLGLLVLIVYYLTIYYLSMAVAQYQADIEKKINELYKKPLIIYDSFCREIKRYGFLRINSKFFPLIPTPSLILGLIIAFVLIIMLFGTEIPRSSALKIFLIGTCSIMALFVFFIFPSMVKKKIKNLEQEMNNQKVH